MIPSSAIGGGFPEYARYVEDGLFFRIGFSSREHVIVRPNIPNEASAPTDGELDWMDVTVEIAADGFRGSFSASMNGDDFVAFRDQVRPLYENLSGKARFAPMEDQLHLDIEGDGKGHFQLRGEALDKAGWGNRLTFAFELDQTELPALVTQLDAICEALRVVVRT